MYKLNPSASTAPLMQVANSYKIWDLEELTKVGKLAVMISDFWVNNMSFWLKQTFFECERSFPEAWPFCPRERKISIWTVRPSGQWLQTKRKSYWLYINYSNGILGMILIKNRYSSFEKTFMTLRLRGSYWKIGLSKNDKEKKLLPGYYSFSKQRDYKKKFK